LRARFSEAIAFADLRPAADSTLAIRSHTEPPSMTLTTEPYLEQLARWPAEGAQILAQFDDDTIIAYQAYRPDIGRFAAEHGYFGGGFKLDRMSWIKTNFLWMMYRSGWGTKTDQEVTLAVRLRRSAFDEILGAAVHSTFQADLYPDAAEWRRAVSRSSVRLQWDPDHEPAGAKTARRAIQLGLRDEFLARYSREFVVGIEDISDFVAEQRRHVQTGDLAALVTPREAPYPVEERLARRLRMTVGGEGA
jgi:hypothetical protein